MSQLVLQNAFTNSALVDLSTLVASIGGSPVKPSWSAAWKCDAAGTQLQSTSSGADYAWTAAPMTSYDMTFSQVLTLRNNDGNTKYPSVVLCDDGQGNGYVFGVSITNLNCGFFINKKSGYTAGSGGTQNSTAASSNPTLVVGTPFTITGTMSISAGTVTMTLALNGTTLITKTDSSSILPLGYVGIASYNPSAESDSVGIAFGTLSVATNIPQTSYAPDNAAIVRTQGNQYTVAGTSIQMIHTASGIEFDITGTTQVGLNLSLGTFVSNYPTLVFSIGGGTWQSAVLTNGQTSLTLASSLSTGTVYSVEVRFEPGEETDTFNTPLDCVNITAITADTGSTISAPAGNATAKPNIAWFDGDSIFRGYNAAKLGGFVSLQSMCVVAARGLNASCVIHAYSGQGVLKSASAGAPNAQSTIGYFCAGRPRTGTPTYHFIGLTTNDTTGASQTTTKAQIANAVQATLGLARTMDGPNTLIMWVAPFFTGLTTFDSATIQSACLLGYQQYISATGDIKAGYMDRSGTYGAWAAGGQFSTASDPHPSTEGHALMGADMVAGMLALVQSLAGGTVVSTF